MKKRILFILNKFRINTLRTFILLTITTIAAISLICTGLLFYIRSSDILTSHYKEDVNNNLISINKNVEDKIKLIDSVYPLIMSDSSIRKNLENSVLENYNYYSNRLSIEKQLAYILISNFLWNEKFLNAVYICDTQDRFYSVTLHNQSYINSNRLSTLLDEDTLKQPSLKISTLPNEDNSIYFIRNIYSINTGKRIATIIININQSVWVNSYRDSINKELSIFLLTKDMKILSENPTKSITNFMEQQMLSAPSNKLTTEATIEGHDYILAQQQIYNYGITSFVLAPKSNLFLELHNTLNSFFLLFCIIIVTSMAVSIILSIIITKPIEKMILHVKEISKGNPNIQIENGLYSEFNEFANAFNYMLKKLDTYYEELYEKQILLKNAQINSLKSQINPHFLFNVLDTIGWKAAMTDNDEIYRMIMSLAEIMRSNTLASEKEFVTLNDELSYIKYYIYLQQMRFEDKLSIEIQASPSLYSYMVPRFCIQPLVENAITHGIEPLKSQGKLCINIIECETYLEIAVIDNGAGFKNGTDLANFTPSSTDTHTHIGLNNLNKRLALLFSEEYHLEIQSVPFRYTAVSFKIPKNPKVNG